MEKMVAEQYVRSKVTGSQQNCEHGSVIASLVMILPLMLLFPLTLRTSRASKQKSRNTTINQLIGESAMGRTIGIGELASAVEKAVASVRLKPGPITIGFVAPQNAAPEATRAVAPSVGMTAVAGPSEADAKRKFAIPRSEINVGWAH
jgi:hypothetical protein